ncbi:MAG: DGQHR domain-containing protein, partial [Bacteroidota bacterium]
MNENLKIELLGKLANESDIVKLLKEKKLDYIRESIKIEDKDIYLSKGWSIEKEFKSSIRVKKEKKLDSAFEDEVWSLFALMGYKFINKDRNFSIPYDNNTPPRTKQIDVFAKDNETVIIVECKSSETRKNGNLKKELESYKGIIGGIRTSVQQLFPNQKLKFKFILATKNIDVSKEDLLLLNGFGGIHFNEDNIDYFFKLFNQIGSASKYQFLGNIFEGQEIPEMENKIPAVRGKMGGHTYYSFAIEPEKILKIGYVLHRNKANENMMPTYQRLIKKSRLKSVGEFIDNGGYFPNSIIINIDAKSCVFEPANTQVKSTIADVGLLHLPKKYKSAFIIDGQHRLYGYSNSDYKNKNTIPVVAFVNLDKDEQVKLFMQINENQKKVSKDLRLTLDSDLKWTSDILDDRIRALCARIAIFLGENKKSKLYNRVTIAEDKRDLTQNNIILALERGAFLGKISKNKIEELGLIYNGDLDAAYDLLKDYLVKSLDYLYESLSSEWENTDTILLSNNGIYGMILLFSDILKYVSDKYNLDIRKDSLTAILSETNSLIDPVINFIKDINTEDRIALKKSYGAGGQTKHWRTFQKSIRDIVPEFNPLGLDEYLVKQERQNNDRAFAIIRDIETYFNIDFKEKLEDHFGNMWHKKGV